MSQQHSLFPEHTPPPPHPAVEWTWKAYDHHFKPNADGVVPITPLTWPMLASILELHAVDRAPQGSTSRYWCRQYPELAPKRGPRGMYPHQHRPWIEHPELLWLLPLSKRTDKDSDDHKDDPPGPTLLVVEGVKYRILHGPNGETRLHWLPSIFAATVCAANMLDLSDGRMDGVIHWCRVLSGLAWNVRL